MAKKEQLLFLILGGFFVTNALVAEFIGVKIFSVEDTLGFSTYNWNIGSISGSLQFSAGVLTWPIVFIMTDIINEYYGQKGVRQLSYLTAGLIAYAFIIIYMSIILAPADWWVGNYQEHGVDNIQSAYDAIFGQGMWIIVGSITAFLVGQILDALLFHHLRKVTGKNIGIRATLSTMGSQLVDSFVVAYIGFYLPGYWTLDQFFALALVAYLYKVFAAIVLIPALYGIHWMIRRYLGQERAEAMITKASQNKLAA